MSTILQITPHDPLIARDGRPFGAGQGNRMRGLPWPLPSVVAGSFRTALVKSGNGDFSGDIPRRLLQIAVAGVFPVHGQQLYFPVPNDAVAEPEDGGKGIKKLHRVVPDESYTVGCDFPECGLKPVMLLEDVGDFKPAKAPAWWPAQQYSRWLLKQDVNFDSPFLQSPRQEIRDHVSIDVDRGAAGEGQIFATAGLNIAHMPRFGVNLDDKNLQFADRFAEVNLSARISIPDSEAALKIGQQFDIWHPLGGERRLAHWQQSSENIKGWTCPPEIRSALETETKIRMVLTTPAIFKQGWLPDLQGGPLRDFKLKLVGVSNGRWKAVSGWSLAKINDKGQLDPNGKPGPKPIRRMVPAGSVYYFEVKQGEAVKLADRWLESVSDDEQERRDGFGLAIWGTW